MPFFKRNREGNAAPEKRGLRREVCLFTLLWAVFFILIYLPPIIRSGFILGADGLSMYYPTLVNFRRSMLEFGQSVKDGHPAFQMMNFDFGFGADNLTTMASYFGLIPYFFFSVLMPESWLATFLTAAVFLLDYLAGLAFLQMCRHFGHSSLWNAVMAFAFVNCNCFTSNFLYNPHFMFMMVAFPLMVIGIDRVIHRTGWKLLGFNVFWLCLTSFTMLVYTLPLLAVFALIRVWFVQREHFLRNLFSAFFRGLSVIFCGVLLSCVLMLPTLYLLKNSIRSVGAVGPDTLELLLPEMSRLNSCFSVQFGSMIPMFFALPGMLILLLFLSKRTELRAYVLAAIVIAALPFFDYALNGFQYSLVRWDFIPSLAFAYAASVGMKELPELSRKKLGILAALLCLYWISYSACFALHYEAGHFFTVFLCVLAVCALIPPVRRFLDRILCGTGKALRAFAGVLRQKEHSAKQYLALGGLVAGVIGLFVCGFLLVLLPDYTFYISLIPACGVTAAVLLLLIRKRSWKRVLLPLLAICWFAGAAVVFWDIRSGDSGTVEQDALIGMMQKESETQPVPGRTVAVDWAAGPKNDDSASADTDAEDEGLIPIRSDRNAATSVFMNNDGKIVNVTVPTQGVIEMNYSLMYGFPDTNTFHNLLDRDMHTLLNKCGISNEYGSLTSFTGFDKSSALYSLFGIGTVGTGTEQLAANTFGMHEIACTEQGKGDPLRLYRYDYALPLGVTYDSYMTDAEYDAADCSVLPFLMLESALTENGTHPSGGALADLESYTCDFSHEKTYVKNNSVGMEVYQHEITINQEVSDCFLYLDVTDVHCRYPKFFAGKSLKIKYDGDQNQMFTLWNENGDWPWLRKTDRYAFNLGYQEPGKAIKSLSFEFSAEYGDMKLYAIPASVLTDAYAARTAETLENISIGTNTLEGDITVSSEKLLSVSLTHNDGWRVYVDETEQPLEKVNRIFLGVMLDEGTHHVRFVYRTPWLTVGLLCSGGGILLWIALAFLYRRKKQVQAA